jgi:hypothetical protein
MRLCVATDRRRAAFSARVLYSGVALRHALTLRDAIPAMLRASHQILALLNAAHARRAWYPFGALRTPARIIDAFAT